MQKPSILCKLNTAMEPRLELEHFARSIRKRSLELVYKAKASHIGGSFSMTDLLAVLYARVLNVRCSEPAWEERDRFLLSKGHACTGLYATLNLLGFIDDKEMESFAQDGSRMTSHVSHKVPGIELSTGSLGHALSIGCGMALAAKRKAKTWRVFVMLSDGELDEGSNWEAILFAPHHKLDNLSVIVDYNKIQSLGSVADVLALEPLKAKFEAFGWQVREIDGHDVEQILAALSSLPAETGRPTAIIANTIKGKGVDFMENHLLWHYRSPNRDEYEAALKQLA